MGLMKIIEILNGGLNVDINVLKTDINGVKSDINSTKFNINTAKLDILTLKENVKSIDDDLLTYHTTMDFDRYAESGLIKLDDDKVGILKVEDNLIESISLNIFKFYASKTIDNQIKKNNINTVSVLTDISNLTFNNIHFLDVINSTNKIIINNDNTIVKLSNNVMFKSVNINNKNKLTFVTNDIDYDFYFIYNNECYVVIDNKDIDLLTYYTYNGIVSETPITKLIYDSNKISITSCESSDVRIYNNDNKIYVKYNVNYGTKKIYKFKINYVNISSNQSYSKTFYMSVKNTVPITSASELTSGLSVNSAYTAFMGLIYETIAENKSVTLGVVQPFLSTAIAPNGSHNCVVLIGLNAANDAANTSDPDKRNKVSANLNKLNDSIVYAATPNSSSISVDDYRDVILNAGNVANSLISTINSPTADDIKIPTEYVKSFSKMITDFVSITEVETVNPQQGLHETRSILEEIRLDYDDLKAKTISLKTWLARFSLPSLATGVTITFTNNLQENNKTSDDGNLRICLDNLEIIPSITSTSLIKFKLSQSGLINFNSQTIVSPTIVKKPNNSYAIRFPSSVYVNPTTTQNMPYNKYYQFSLTFEMIDQNNKYYGTTLTYQYIDFNIDSTRTNLDSYHNPNDQFVRINQTQESSVPANLNISQFVSPTSVSS